MVALKWFSLIRYTILQFQQYAALYRQTYGVMANVYCNFDTDWATVICPIHVLQVLGYKLDALSKCCTTSEKLPALCAA